MFIELNILLIDKSLSNLGIEGSEDEVEVKFTVNTNSIEAFREILDEDGSVIQDECMLYLNGNESFIIKHSYNEIKKLIK